MNLIRNIQIIPSTKTAVCPAKTTMYGPPVDMSDCNGVLFLALGSTEFAGMTSDARASIQMSSSTGLAVGSWSHYGATHATPQISNTTGQSRLVAIDFYRPVVNVPGSGISRPYARMALTGGTGYAVMCAIKYGLRTPGATGWYSSGLEVLTATIIGATKNT